MNRKVLVGGGAGAAVAVIFLAYMGLNILQPAPQTGQTPPAQEKPKFHPFELTYMMHKISFHLQNLGNVSANNITVTITAKWNPAAQDQSHYPRDGNKTLYSVVYYAEIRKMEAKETNEYMAEIVWENYITLITHPDSAGLREYDISITCAEEVTETFSQQAY